MFNLILLFLDVGLFVLSIVFLILDVKSYESEKNEEFKTTLISKRSRLALLFGLLALVVSVIVSLGY
ncbi:MAG: hypothetical protein ACFFEY_09755 [Candidatus Thorarchaeota archaeon]